MRLGLELVVLALLSGCALWPLSEADCRVASWERRGYADGYGGHPPQYLRLARKCPRFGIEVSEMDYYKGWQDGRFEWERLWGHMQKRGG